MADMSDRSPRKRFLVVTRTQYSQGMKVPKTKKLDLRKITGGEDGPCVRVLAVYVLVDSHTVSKVVLNTKDDEDDAYAGQHMNLHHRSNQRKDCHRF